MINSILRVLFIAISILTFSTYAGDLSWSGSYRIEGMYLNNTQLSDSNKDKDYGLHHLVLRPRIEASDGLTIRARLDLFNNSTHANSQLGQVFGSGVGDGSPSSTDDSNSISQNEKSESLVVNELYMTLMQEFGALIAGRAPMQFGLGITYNAGNEMFDHWFDNRDVVGYKMVFGNFWFLPMVAKINEGQIGDIDDITEYILQLEYENPETDLSFGALYRISNINAGASDAPGSPVFGDVASPTRSDKYAVNYLNVYTKKKTDTYSFGIELAHQDGGTGVEDSNGAKVKASGFAIAGEYEYRKPESKWSFGSLFGMASGDNPNTTDKYEGYLLDRNYDVAMLLMNHQLGQANIFRTSYYTGTTSATHDSVNTYDTEAISNVTYLAPYFKYQWKEKWDIQGKFVTGFLSETENLAGASKTAEANIGYELDFSINYRPNKNLLWSTEIGVLMPGAAFEVDGQYDSDLAYGMSTRAAINF